MQPDRTRLLYHPVQPLSSWTVAQVRSALRRHEEGDLSRSAPLAEHMERNPRIFAALGTRVMGVQGLAVEIEPNEDGDRRRANAVAKSLQKNWYAIAPEDVLGDLHRWAILVGVSIAEIVWDTSGS